MSNKVRWFESMKYLEKNKNKKINEFGPGKVLSGLIKRIDNCLNNRRKNNYQLIIINADIFLF